MFCVVWCAWRGQQARWRARAAAVAVVLSVSTPAYFFSRLLLTACCILYMVWLLFCNIYCVGGWAARLLNAATLFLSPETEDLTTDGCRTARRARLATLPAGCTRRWQRPILLLWGDKLLWMLSVLSRRFWRSGGLCLASPPLPTLTNSSLIQQPTTLCSGQNSFLFFPSFYWQHARDPWFRSVTSTCSLDTFSSCNMDRGGRRAVKVSGVR